MLYSLFVFATIFVPVEHPHVRQTRMPWGTLVVTIACAEESEIKHFVDCMQGPPYRCWPLRLPDRSIAGWYAFGPDQPLTGTRYVCVGGAGSCNRFDRDFDGDIDLADWARYTANDWGQRAEAITPASRVWDGRYANLPYVLDAESLASLRPAWRVGSCGVSVSTCYGEIGQVIDCPSD